MTTSMYIKIGLGLLMMFMGILLMNVIVKLLAVLLVGAGGFIAGVALWDYIALMTSRTYADTFMNEWR